MIHTPFCRRSRTMNTFKYPGEPGGWAQAWQSPLPRGLLTGLHRGRDNSGRNRETAPARWSNLRDNLLTDHRVRAREGLPRSVESGRSLIAEREMRRGAVPAMGGRVMAGLLALCLTWSVAVRYAEHGQDVHRDLPMSFQAQADCLRMLASFREELLHSFTQEGFAGMFTLTGTVISVRMDPNLAGIRRWLPWNYQAVRVKSACQETSP
jgi:hypothetical protein